MLTYRSQQVLNNIYNDAIFARNVYLFKCETTKRSCCYVNFFTFNPLTTTLCHNAMTISNSFCFKETTIPNLPSCRPTSLPHRNPLSVTDMINYRRRTYKFTSCILLHVPVTTLTYIARLENTTACRPVRYIHRDKV